MNSNTPPISSQPQFLSLAISEIILDDTINTRPINYEIAAEYRETMLAYGVDSWQDHWNELPRITASKHLFSGFHTVTAVKVAFGTDHILRCAVEGETYRDAFFLATGTNAQHGRRRSNAEKFESVLRWLVDEKEREWTNGHIAAQCQVTPQYVGRISKDLETDSSSEEWEYYADYRKRVHGEDTPTPYKRPAYRTFPKADGCFETMDTAKIGTTPSYDSQAQIQTDYKGMIKHRDAAHDKWKAYCEKWGIDFNWDDFCLYAEKHLDGSGCVSAINPEEATLDQIREKSLTWQKMKDAISGNANWVISHRLGLEHQEYRRKKSEPTEEEDRETRRKAYEKCVKSSDHVFHRWNSAFKQVKWQIFKEAMVTAYPDLNERMAFDHAENKLSVEDLNRQTQIWKNTDADIDTAEDSGENWVRVLLRRTEKDVSEILTEASEEEKSKESLMDAYDDLSSAVYALWDKNLKKHYAWSEVYAAAKSNWPAIADVMRYSAEDESEESLKFQVAVWTNLKKDMDFAVLQIEDLDSIESTDSWLLKKLIASEEAYEPPPSNGTGAIYGAYKDARRAYQAMMGGEPVQKVADKYWESFLAEAKGNAPRGYGLPRGNPTGEGDSVYDESSSKRIAGAWDWITEQCQASPHPDWLRKWILETCCQMSSFALVVHGRNFEGEIHRLEYQANIPLSHVHIEEIATAAFEAAEDAYVKVSAKRGKELQDFRCAKDKSQSKPTFETVKYAKE